jgi:AcrR family transcriptional regulator
VTGLRERKKQRTRDALIRAAHELFVTQGYETSTIDEITAAVDVSQRTFFRYFASKEEVAVALHALIDERFLAAVRERPLGEPPLEVLRNTLDESWESIGEAVKEVVSPQLHMRMWRVIETTPALVAEQLRRSVEMEELLAAEIAEREGLDLGTDPRPRVLVAAYSGVLRAAGRSWGTGDDVSVDSVRELARTYVDQLGPALSQDWKTREGGGTPGGGASTETRSASRRGRCEQRISAKPAR